MDFTLVKEGQKDPIAESGHSDFYLRSVHLEAELEQGNYIVYVSNRIQPFLLEGRNIFLKRKKEFSNVFGL
jgi:hypothetical protein